MKKLPAIQFYPGDWHRDPGVQLLSFEDRGIWFELLLRMHDSEEHGALTINGRAMTDDEIELLIGLPYDIPGKIKQTLANLLSKNVATRRQTDGAFCCRRMLKYKDLSESRAKAGHNGGVAKALAKFVAKPSSSSSSSSSSSEEKNKNKNEEETPQARKISPELIQEQWNKIVGVKICKKLGGALLQRIKRLLREHPVIDWWTELFLEIAKSPFLTGRIPGREGKRPFRADLDWATGPTNLGKILSGKYADEQVSGQAKVLQVAL